MPHPFTGLEIMSYDSNYEHIMDVAGLYRWAVEMTSEAAEQSDEWLDEFRAGLNYIESRVQATPEDMAELRLLILVDYFKLTMFETVCLSLAVAAEIFEGVSYSIYRRTKKLLPDFWLANFLTSLTGISSGNIYASFQPNAPFTYLFKNLTGNMPLLSAEFKLNKNVLSYITGAVSPEEAHIDIPPDDKKFPARIIRPAFGLDDVIVAEKTKTLLKQICLTFKTLPKLYSEWGFGRLFPYGRGLGILFHGASGTGKTMAAHAVAKELGLEVMSVDLSCITDKYIGETEKRLTEVFERAAERRCILFFDEGDALFAKRTDVSDSLDRHANAQTAHLLQKMEEYDGIVILATNLLENVDDAFKRRLPFIVGFSRPDIVLRRELWSRFIPSEVPRSDVDIDALARFDLTPAVMKWAALSASVSALADGEVLSMAHILSALQYEYEKMGVAFPDMEINKIIL